MSTKNIELRGVKETEKRTVGNTYDGKQIYKVSPNLYENYTTKYFTPNTGSPATYHSLSLDWLVALRLAFLRWLPLLIFQKFLTRTIVES